MRAISPLRCSALLLTAALTTGIVTVSGLAAAQEEVEIDLAPPPVRVEVIPAAPSPRHFWIHGYYGWYRGAHVWYPGRYELNRTGWSWSEARWALVGRRWHFYPGHWYH